MAVDVALDGTDALAHLAGARYEVVVLDRDLPGTHGDEICRQIVAERSGSRVLMLTAAGTVKDRVEGLGLGADDYLPKPFDFTELVARVRTLGRRPPRPRRPPSRQETSRWTPAADSPSGPGGASISAPKSSPSWNACSPPAIGWSRPRTS